MNPLLHVMDRVLYMAGGGAVLGKVGDVVKRGDDVLNMDFYDAITGALRGRAQATRIAGSSRVEAFKIWYVEFGILITFCNLLYTFVEFAWHAISEVVVRK